MSSMESLDYGECYDSLRRAQLPFSPSEVHAMAVGMLSGDVADSEGEWAKAMFADLDPNDALAQACRKALVPVFDVAQAQVADASFSLQLWLPEEGIGGIARDAALRDWVQGFLFGFGLAGEAVALRLSPEGQEVLRDLYEIAQLDTADEILDEESQQALVEVEEYVRVAAMLVNEDMHAPLGSGEGHERH